MSDNLSWPRFLKSHLLETLPYPTKKFTGKTIIVTGANSGLGLEAARHFVRLDAARVILAVRNLSKGEAAAKSIAQSTQRTNVCEVWEVDLASYTSIKAFAAKVDAELDRLDIMVSNAGVLTRLPFMMVEEDELHVTVNVVSTMMLSILLLPKLRETAAKTGQKTVLTFTGSWMHKVATYPEFKADDIFKELSNEKSGRKDGRYEVSKLLLLLLYRELVERSDKSDKDHSVIISCLNPGAVTTDISRDPGLAMRTYTKVSQVLLCRKTEEGSRTLVHAAEGDPETHGQYLDDCKIGETSHFVASEEGHKVQQRLWLELSEKLERIQPGMMQKV